MNAKTWLCVAMLTCLHGLLPAMAGISLDGWSSDGANPRQLIQNGELILSEDAQLYREVEGSGVTLRIVSSPVFSSEPNEVSILEFGADALIFLKKDHTGQLALIQSDALRVLPYEVALDDTGRAAEPLILDLTQRGGRLLLTFRNSVHQFDREVLSGSGLIVLSSGRGQSWIIEALSVTSERHSAIGTTGDKDARDLMRDESTDDAADSLRSGISNPQGEVSLDPLKQSNNDSTRSEVSRYEASLQRARDVGLEVFTPPAVRRGRSAAIRASLERAELKGGYSR